MFLDRDAPSSIAEHEKWILFIERLTQWAQHPEELDDGESSAPSGQAIQQARALIDRLVEKSFPAPTRIVPDNYGGVVIEYRKKGNSHALRVSSTGSIEFVAFENAKLIQRCKIESVPMK